MKPSERINDLFAAGEPDPACAGQWPDWFVHLRAAQRQEFERSAVDTPPFFDEGWVGGGAFADAPRIQPEPFGFAAVNDLSLIRPQAPCLVFINGHYSETLSKTARMPQGVICGSLATNIISRGPALKACWDAAEPTASRKADPFKALNFARFQDGLFLQVPDKTVVEEPIQILLVDTNTSGSRLAVYPRIFVWAGASSRLQLVIHQTSLSQSRPYFHCGVSELYLGPGACVDWSFVQRPQEHSIGIWRTDAYLKRHASLETLLYGDRGSLLRQAHTFHLLEEHAFVSFRGLSVLSGNSDLQNTVVADHVAGHCLSRQHHKSICFDSSSSEFDSLVRVRRNAFKSDSRQLCRNLLVSDTARAVALPKLKINADDVSCAHGASTGPLQDAEVFYLKSRGLNEYQARSMLTCGFAQEILDQVHHPELNLRLQTMAETQIEHHLRKRQGNG